MRNWKIYYSSFEGPEKRAVELIYREMGEFLLRDKGIYSYFVLSCENTVRELDSNAVILGTYGSNEIFAEYISKEEVPENGYVVKVIDNPENSDYKLALICGYSAPQVFYGAVDFVDDYFAVASPNFDSIVLRNELFCNKLPDYYISTAPDFKTRSIFTWGHPISDYQEYIGNLARLKLNQLIIWNDFLPINAKDIVDCAHSYGMEVIWGFAWGWSQRCADAKIRDLEGLKNSIVEEYNRTYKGVCGDGIYFQSFTELHVDNIDGVSISEAVTKLVNMTAAEILKNEPHLHIQFGLHASSVKEHLEDIAKVDERVEIVWEDCGAFPYRALPEINEENHKANIDFTESIINLRKNGDCGLVYKCQTTMDWTRGRVEHQAGPYVMGCTEEKVKNHDLEILNPLWRVFSVDWLEKGHYAYELTRAAKEASKGNANMCIAGMFSGGIWYPTALCAQMYWNCSEPFEKIQKKVLNRIKVNF